MESDHKALNKSKVEVKTSFEKPNSVGNSSNNNSFCKTHLKDESSFPINMPTNSPMSYSTHHNHGSSSFFVTNCNNSSLESTKKKTSMEYTNPKSADKIEATGIQNSETNKVWNKNNQEAKSEKFVKNLTTTSIPKQFILPESSQDNLNTDFNRNESKTSEITDEKRQNLLSDFGSYRQHRTDGVHTNSSTQQSPFPDQKDNNAHLLYGYNSQAQHRTNYIDYTSHHSTTGKNEEELAQNKPHNSIQLNTQSPSFNNPEASASFINPSVNVSEHIQRTQNIHYPSREIYGSSHPQYYGDIYDPNPIGAPASYPSQFSNYAAYSSYSHPHFRPSFHGNVQNASSAAVSSNPYMTWPFMSSSGINEPCNAIYSTSYTQNSPHQYNQWHNQR